MAAPKSSILYLVGMPLQESQPLSAEARAILKASPLVIGESRKEIDRRLKQSEALPAEVFALDHFNPQEQKCLKDSLKKHARSDLTVALFSDCGMPVLFDPGTEVLTWARQLGYVIKVCSGPTSWATACASSGFAPPFTLIGFLPQKKEERGKLWKSLKSTSAHLVLLETPYRFRALLEEAQAQFGKHRRAFVGWELDSESQRLEWNSLGGLIQWAEQNQLSKGEFILIIEAP